MPKFVRVKNKMTGSEYTVAADLPLGEDVVVLNKPATNRDGKPLPEKHKTNLAPARAEEHEPSTTKADTKATTPQKEKS